jgi:hypothetical protein
MRPIVAISALRVIRQQIVFPKAFGFFAAPY